MQTIQDLQDKLFFECKNILDTVSKISSHDELLRKHDLITELNDRMNVLKYLDKNKSSFTAPVAVDTPSSLLEKEEFIDEKPENIFEEEIEEEVIFNNELNEIDPNENLNQENSEELVEEFELVEDYAIEEKEVVEAIEEKEIPMRIVNEAEKKEAEEEVYAEHVVEQEEGFRQEIDEVLEKSDDLHVEENSVEEEEVEIQEPVSELLKEEPQEIVEVEKSKEEDKDVESPETQEKKFKLSNIKGMKAVQSLFDDDPLEEMIEEEKKHEAESGSILKSNVSTDFMEAAKPRQEFRLDLNDKIAFSKVLFDGSQSELNDAIRNLNDCKTLDEAKEYLSDLYYARNWKKADDVAQRLWTLVENKFH